VSQVTDRLLTAVTSNGLLKEAMNSLIMEEPATYNYKSKSKPSCDSDDSDCDASECASDDSDCSEESDGDYEYVKKKKSGLLPAPIVYPVLLAGQIF
jgi:hypothetical protein